MSKNGKVIITAALTGAIHTPTMSPYLPLSPDELIKEAVAVHEAGGAVVHLHVRNPETGYPSSDQDDFRRVAEAIKRRCDIIICPTTGGPVGEPVSRRAKVVSTLEPEMASLNSGSMNFAIFRTAEKYNSWRYGWEEKYLIDTEDYIFANTFKTMRELLEIFQETGTKPEFEIYDVGMINNLAYLIEAGHVPKPVYIQFVLGIMGGIPATSENLIFLVETARKSIGDFEFSVCAAGRNQIPMGTLSIILGGNVRVGLEDSLFLARGVLAKSNAEQVSKIVRIARELGLEPASPQEAREILGLKGIGQVSF